MTFLKRAIATLSLFSVLVVGSLSFFPRSSAVDDFVFPFSEDEVLSRIPSSAVSCAVFAYSSVYQGNTIYWFRIYWSDSSPLTFYQSGSSYLLRNASGALGYSSSTDSWSTPTLTPSFNSSISWGSLFPSSLSFNFSPSVVPPTSFSYSFTEPVVPLTSSPKFFDYSPFYFPELPYGVFDGNYIAGFNGTQSLSLNFDNLTGTSTGSFSYSESGSGSGTYSGSSTSSGGTISGGTYTGSGSLTIPSGTYLGDYSGDNFNTGGSANDTSEGQIYMPNGSSASLPISTSGSFSGSVSGSSGSESGSLTITSLSESGSGSVNIGDTYSGNVTGSFSYNPSYSDLARFRTWAVVSGTAYVYFISDVRNRITASLESVSDSGAKVRYLCKGDDGVFYPCYCVTFNYFGEKVASLSQLPNGFTVDFAPGTLSHDEESGKWSVDPLYHGVWFSDQSPSLNLSSLADTENLKWLANPVFGESAFVLNFLDSINSTLVTINDNLVSLTAAMQQSISNQTSAFQNMDAQPSPQPDTSNMMQYFADSSVFEAPDASGMFDNGLNDAPYWSGVTWWKDRFQELFVGNLPVQQVMIAFTTATLTLGLAVMIIGRRFSMR